MPPYGELIEAAREAAGLSRREAARRAGISDAWWRYVTRGWQNGPITGPADTVAVMARVVGLTPERLESEGERPDAAGKLREMIAREEADRAADPYADEDEALQEILRDERLPEDVRRGLVALAKAMRDRSDFERDGRSALRAPFLRGHHVQPRGPRPQFRSRAPGAGVGVYRGESVAVGADPLLEVAEPGLGVLLPFPVGPLAGAGLVNPERYRAARFGEGDRPGEPAVPPVHAELFPQREHPRPCRRHKPPQDAPRSVPHRPRPPPAVRSLSQENAAAPGRP